MHTQPFVVPDGDTLTLEVQQAFAAKRFACVLDVDPGSGEATVSSATNAGAADSDFIAYDASEIDSSNSGEAFEEHTAFEPAPFRSLRIVADGDDCTLRALFVDNEFRLAEAEAP